ncbi:MAG TPA: hypothetical protein VGL35_14775 [Rhizomicrobium sp.]
MALPRHHARACGQEQFQPAAETDYAKTIAAAYFLSFPKIALYPAGYQTRDLHNSKVNGCAVRARRPYPDRHPLVIHARLVESGIEEFAGPIRKSRHCSIAWDAVHMHIEYRHENT